MSADSPMGERQRAILQLLRTGKVHTQVELAHELRLRNIEATQATVSRDLRRLGAARLPSGDGPRYFVAGPLEETEARAAEVFATQLRSLEPVGAMLVLRTPVGAAQVVAAAVDALKLSGVAGTVAGDDTIFVQARSARAARAVELKVEELRRIGRGWRGDQ